MKVKSTSEVTAAATTAAKSLQSCPTLCDPIDGRPPGSPVLGFSRQEYWSGLPLPSPMHESQSEVGQSCLTLSDPMDCSLPGSSVQGFSRQEYWSGVPLPSPVFFPRRGLKDRVGERTTESLSKYWEHFSLSSSLTKNISE